jgi:hypothetical protein
MSTATENPVTNSTDEAEEEAQAAEAFAEAAAAREASPSDGSDDDLEETGAATDTSGAGDQGNKSTTGEGSGATSQGQSGGSEGSAAEAAGSGEGDIWANVPPEAKAAYEAAVEQAKTAEHRFKSREGREAALQRQIAELRRTGGQEEPERKPLKDLLKKETVEELGNDYPDLKPVLEALSAAVDRIDGVEQQVGEVKTSVVASASSVEEAKLVDAVPDWLELAQHDQFMAWVEDQPKKVRDAVDANWAAITNATQAAEVFKSFAEHIAPKQEETGGGGAPSKRARQQSGARAATVTAPASASGDGDDADLAFAQAAKKQDRARGIVS